MQRLQEQYSVAQLVVVTARWLLIKSWMFRCRPRRLSGIDSCTPLLGSNRLVDDKITTNTT